MSRWDVSWHRNSRDSHLRKARRASEFARDPSCDKNTRRIWREHAAMHVHAAREAQWRLIAQARCVSAGMFLRKTIGADIRARG